MSDLLQAIKTFLGYAWKFFTKTDVPGLDFSFAALFIGAALIPISLSFLSLILGFPVGSVSDAQSFGARGSRKTKVSSARKNDTR